MRGNQCNDQRPGQIQARLEDHQQQLTIASRRGAGDRDRAHPREPGEADRDRAGTQDREPPLARTQIGPAIAHLPAQVLDGPAVERIRRRVRQLAPREGTQLVVQLRADDAGDDDARRRHGQQEEQQLRDAFQRARTDSGSYSVGGVFVLPVGQVGHFTCAFACALAFAFGGSSRAANVR